MAESSTRERNLTGWGFHYPTPRLITDRDLETKEGTTLTTAWWLQNANTAGQPIQICVTSLHFLRYFFHKMSWKKTVPAWFWSHIRNASTYLDNSRMRSVLHNISRSCVGKVVGSFRVNIAVHLFRLFLNYHRQICISRENPSWDGPWFSLLPSYPRQPCCCG